MVGLKEGINESASKWNTLSSTLFIIHSAVRRLQY